MAILDKEKLEQCLNEYYEEHYGRQNTDIWYEQPAVNVWVFGRDGKIITLKSHLLTGAVSEKIEEY
ncbi:MAG: hypothetical protein J6K00_02965 [Oscillospiraceae bacterium]|nr:hypothetical protein [Oscillospiraceae bacterium]